MSEADLYPDLLYHPGHSWAEVKGTIATFGITWYAQSQLGEIVYWDGRKIGETATVDEPYGEIESTKTFSDVISPLSGTVVETNDLLADDPEPINRAPFTEGWLLRVELDDPTQVSHLLTRSAYLAQIDA